jgi:hypothetical protein
MKAKYKDKVVKITKLVLHKDIFLTYPIVQQVRIEWKDGKETISEYVDANDIVFLN